MQHVSALPRLEIPDTHVTIAPARDEHVINILQGPYAAFVARKRPYVFAVDRTKHVDLLVVHTYNDISLAHLQRRHDAQIRANVRHKRATAVPPVRLDDVPSPKVILVRKTWSMAVLGDVHGR
jgi:hypothetical protein